MEGEKEKDETSDNNRVTAAPTSERDETADLDGCSNKTTSTVSQCVRQNRKVLSTVVPTSTSGASSSTTSANVLNSSFDRLKPRSSVEKRRLASSSSSLSSPSTSHCQEDEADHGAKRTKRMSFRKEYGKLKNLVPALSEREDLSKVEIVEETIRYIDALHHQLSARMLRTSSRTSASAARSTTEPELDSQPSTTGGAESSSEANDSVDNSSQEPRTRLPNCPSHLPPPPPLRPMSSVSLEGQQNNRGEPEPSASSSSSASISTSTPQTASASSSATMSSPSEVKAAVENIQAMFAMYLDQQHS